MKAFIYILLFTGLSIASSAQSNSVIGHINMNEILQALPEVDSVRSVLEKETKEIETIYEEMQVNYNNLVNDYKNGLAGFTDLQRKTKADEITDKETRLQEFEQNANLRLQRRNMELMQPIYTGINRAVQKIAGNKGIDYVLDLSTGTVVFTSETSMNSTQAVIREITGDNRE